MSSSETKTLQASPLRGMDQRHRPDPTQARTVRDMSWDQRDGWKVSGGLTRMVRDYEVEGSPVSSFTGLGSVTALKWFSQHNGNIQWVFYESGDGALRYFNGSTVPSSGAEFVADEEGNLYNGSARERKQSSVSSAGTMFTQWGDLVYMANGKQPVVVFDGFKLSTAGFLHVPPAPDPQIRDSTLSTTQYAAIGVLGLGTEGGESAYQYRITYVNERGQESEASQPSSTVRWDNPANSHYCVTLQISLGPPGTVARRIYRTQTLVDSLGLSLVPADAALYYFTAEIQDNLTNTFVDLRPDESLGSVLNERALGTAPSNVSVLGVFKGVMFAAGRQGVHYSSPGAPEEWPSGNFFPFGGDDSGAATGMFATRDALVFTRERGIYLIRGTPQSGFSLDTFDQAIGNAAPHSLIQIPGLGLAMLAVSGIYLLEGALENTGTPTRLVHLSADIPLLMRDVNSSALPECSATLNLRDKEAWFAVAVNGVSTPSRILVYHYEVGSWSYRDKIPAGRLTSTSDHRGLVIIGSNEANRPGLYVYSHGFNDKSGAPAGAVVALDPVYETPDMDLGSMFYSKGVRHVFMVGIGFGRNDVSMNMVVNRGFSDVYDTAPTRDQLYAEEAEASGERTLAFYANIVLDGTSKWYRHRKVTIRFDGTVSQQALLHELRIRFAWSGLRGHIIAWGLELEGGHKRPILTLNAKHGAT